MEFDNGETCRIGDFKADKAMQLALYLSTGHNPFVTLIECSKSTNRDIVCVEVKAELSQVRINDIRPIESIAIHFDPTDSELPKVYALRKDFPRRIPHLNLEWKDWPASLCLYNERYRDIKPLWTPPRFLERIREWLKETANGTLHKDDQPLEPLLFGSNTHLIIPSAILESSNSVEQLAIIDCSESDNGKSALRVISAEQMAQRPPNQLRLTALKIQLPVQEHGIIHHMPRTLNELHDLFRTSGYDLIFNLQSEMKKWTITKEIQDSSLAIIAWFPKKRTSDAAPDATDIWVFVTTKKVHEVLEDIGVYAGHVASGNYNVPLLSGFDESKRGENTIIQLFNPTLELTPEKAAILNGSSEASDQNIFAIGAGSLGSHVVMNCVRAGFGKWTLVDDDILLPHNMARHALDGFFLGRSKVASLQAAANHIVTGVPIANAIQADFIQPGSEKDRLEKALSETDVLLDMSAALTVARYATHGLTTQARRVSIFLAPSGNDLVILAEDKKRSLKLDHLEMQYYRELCHDDRLADHLASVRKTRYANSCRDVSSQISQDSVALLSAIASGNLKGRGAYTNFSNS
jgi:Prokaryotic E2 family A/ThiF family